ncbi:MAG TPA: DEAD/DEAH box helicase, partial [Ignavibacteriaceae bacterium]
MNSFEGLGLDQKILSAIKELNFENPMPVQEKIIPMMLQDEPQDIIALAQTGTGKTAAFGLPIIHKTDTTLKQVQYLIIAPTRELCLQIADDLKDYAAHNKGIKIAAIFGGSSMDRQIQNIKRGAQIISATPGRLNDLINRGEVNLSNVKAVVLDEADEMLNMGFKEELEAILETTPKTRNTFLFSATMPNPLLSIANRYMKKPVEVTIGRKNSGAENVEHVSYLVHARDKYLALKRIVDFHPNVYGIVFCRTRQETKDVSEKLMQDGYDADALHGDLSQSQREAVLNKFRTRHLRILVATDVAARGLDVD